MPGVTFGNDVLIAAGSVVTKSLRSSNIAAGNPRKIIATVKEFEKIIDVMKLKLKI